MPEKRNGRVDLALLATVSIWGVNFSVVKATLTHLPALGFNSLRLFGASVVFLLLARLFPSTKVAARDWPRFVLLGLIGHTGYQLSFILGIEATTAGNAAILLGMTPVFVALLGLGLRIESPRLSVWLGIAISVVGVTLVMADSELTGGDRFGDFLTLAATLCWSVYTVMGQSLIRRYGLFKTNAYSMALGSLGIVPAGLPSLMALEPSEITLAAWWGTLFSLLFALVVAYCLWYYAVSRVGPTSTAIYANLTPVAGLAVSWLWLGEPLGRLQALGGAVILIGIYLVRRQG